MLDGILMLRAQAKKDDLKELSPDYIAYHISEFYVVLANGILSGCFRIFTPPSYPHLLELGSVKTDDAMLRKWIWTYMVTEAEKMAQEQHKTIIAVTGGNLDNTLEKRWWKDQTSLFPKRKIESIHDRIIWVFGNP